MRIACRVRLASCALALSVAGCATQNLPPGANVQYPWIFQSDVIKRLDESPIVVSGIISATKNCGKIRLDGLAVRKNCASIDIDRIFKGRIRPGVHTFVWYSPAGSRGGVAYSGPPIASFKPRTRYLVFLRTSHQKLTVAMPIYAMEMELSSTPQVAGLVDLTDRPDRERDSVIAHEFEAAALSMPTPQLGTTGKAAMYFQPVIQLIGGCAQTFFDRFRASPSLELRAEAERYLGQIHERHLECSDK